MADIDLYVDAAPIEMEVSAAQGPAGDTGPAGPAGADGAAGATGATGPAGSDANVTNANVNAAIEDDVSATMATLGAASLSGGNAFTGDQTITGNVTLIGSGTITATGGFTGNLTGNAATATALTSGDKTIAGTLTATAAKIPKFSPSADSVTAIQITKANGSTVVGNWDTTNGRLGIGTVAPNANLHLVTTNGSFFPLVCEITGSGANSIALYPYSDGKAYIQHSGDLVFSQTASITPQMTIATSGAISVAGTLSVTGTSSHTGAADFAGGLTATTGTFSKVLTSGGDGGGGGHSLAVVAGTNTYGFVDGGNNALRFGVLHNPFCYWYPGSEQRMTGGARLTWAPGTPDGGADTGITRNAAGVLEINNGTAGAYRDLNSRNQTLSGTLAVTGTTTLTGGLILPTSTTPASASAAGVAGTVCRDADYIYICTATNTWKRVAISTW